MPAFAGMSGNRYGATLVHLGDERPHLRHDLRQHGADLGARHARTHARVIENIENVLIVDVEESHRDLVVEHGPGDLVGIVDRPERLQQLLVGAVVEDEIARVGDQKHIRVHDAQLGILAEAREALRIERFPDAAYAVAPKGCAQRRIEFALAQQADDDVRLLAVRDNRDVEMLDRGS